MISNKKILSRYLQEDEKILWSSKPFAKKYPICNNPWVKYPFSAVLGIISGILLCHFTIDDFWKGEHVLRNLFSACLMLFSGTIVTIDLISLLFGPRKHEMLGKTEYFITNRQIFSIRESRKILFKKFKQLVNVPLKYVKYYFIQEKKFKSKTTFDVFLKIKMDTMIDWQDTILECSKMKDYELKYKYPALIIRDEGWVATSLETIQILRNVIDIVELKTICKELGLDYRDPPDNPEEMLGSEFYNPY